MVITAIVLISLAVILGGYLLSFVLQARNPPKGIVIAHGTLAALGIIILLIYALTTDEPHKHWDSIIIFVLAATGGIYLVSRDIRHKDVPKWVAIVHGAIGLTGLIWILTHTIH